LDERPTHRKTYTDATQYRITWLYNHIATEVRSCNRRVRTVQGPCSHWYRRLSYAINIALSYGKNEAKFTSMTYKDATIITPLHMFLLNYFL